MRKKKLHSFNFEAIFHSLRSKLGSRRLVSGHTCEKGVDEGLGKISVGVLEFEE